MRDGERVRKLAEGIFIALDSRELHLWPGERLRWLGYRGTERQRREITLELIRWWRDIGGTWKDYKIVTFTEREK